MIIDVPEYEKEMLACGQLNLNQVHFMTTSQEDLDELEYQNRAIINDKGGMYERASTVREF